VVLTQNPVNNRFGVKKISKADILSLFTLIKSLQKIYTSLAPNCISRVTRKIVASIGTFQKIILQGIVFEKW